VLSREEVKRWAEESKREEVQRGRARTVRVCEAGKGECNTVSITGGASCGEDKCQVKGKGVLTFLALVRNFQNFSTGNKL